MNSSKQKFYATFTAALLMIFITVSHGYAASEGMSASSTSEQGKTKKKLVPQSFVDDFKDSLSSHSLSSDVPYFQKTSTSDMTYLSFMIRLNASELKKSERVIPYLIAELLTKGTKSYPRGKIENFLEKYSIRLSCSPSFMCGTTYSSVSCFLTVDNQYLQEGLSVLASVIKEPSFDQADYQVAMKNARISAKKTCLSDPDLIANNALNTIFYNHDHPWFTTDVHLLKSLDMTTLDKVKTTYQKIMNASRMMLSSISSVKPKVMVTKLNASFAPLPRWFTKMTKIPKPTHSSRSFVVKFSDDAPGTSGDTVSMILKNLLPGIYDDKSVAFKLLHEILNQN
ncbi:MAG: insulinase family protein, partial [Proteobacteria bacterium]|nr:insulinase family protein [Pseudomonadota bacterium]